MMLTTIELVKQQLNIPEDDTTEDEQLTRIIKATSVAIETYCCREFSDDYTLPGQEGEGPRLPHDVEDACILWSAYRYQTGGRMGVSSERIDGLGQKNYSLQHIDGKYIPAPPAVLALLDPYRRPVLG